MKEELSIFWFRRDLRLDDNKGLSAALKSGRPVLPIYIFDTNIIEELRIDDARLTFIYDKLLKLNTEINSYKSSLQIYKGDPLEIIKGIDSEFNIKEVYFNHDYEPYAINRDSSIQDYLRSSGIACHSFKDQVIFERNEVMKLDNTAYTVFTPYSRSWKARLRANGAPMESKTATTNFFKYIYKFPSQSELGFSRSSIRVEDYRLEVADNYENTRNFPWMEGTSKLGPHLRFGTVSIRQVVNMLSESNQLFLNELIWREFFMQVLYHFPDVITENFRKKYDGVRWRNNEEEFELWCQGKTGFPLVDAGMRQLNQTGTMHNRVRMVCAGFLCKHLLIDWRWGEAYFAEKLLDYELASNNGNWQWAAGTGCDAAPYFRIFNPMIQLKKFDKNFEYLNRWIPELNTPDYPEPIVDYSFARGRALETYKRAIDNLAQ